MSRNGVKVVTSALLSNGIFGTHIHNQQKVGRTFFLTCPYIKAEFFINYIVPIAMIVIYSNGSYETVLYDMMWNKYACDL